MSATVVFWDVQHGHATYIRTPNGRHIVIDLGTGDYSGGDTEFSPLSHLKNNYNVWQLDYVVITHPHLDHIDDILNFDSLDPKVLNRPKQITNEEIMEGVRDKDRAKFEKYCEINNRYNSSIEDDSPNKISNPDNWGGMKIATFTPYTCNHNNFNNHSIVAVIEYEGIKVIIPGDNEACSFEELLSRQAFKTAVMDADVLLAPHHGRESGYNSDFVDLVNPRLTIVSDGKYCDTSANSRYSQKSRGWGVYKKSTGKSTNRYCLTTNSDGEVYVNFGKSTDPNYNSYLNVSIN